MKIYTLIALLFVNTIIGCESSLITSSWKSESTPAIKHNKIMVVALVGGNDDHELRENIENHLLGDLSEKGYTVISAYKTYGPKAFENLSESQVINKLTNSGVEAVLTIVMLNKEKEKYYVPGRVYYTPYTIYHRRFWGYYSTMYDRTYEPGYYSEETNYFLEYNLYDLETKALLYSAQTKSFNPDSAEKLAHENDKLIVTDLLTKKVLK